MAVNLLSLNLAMRLTKLPRTSARSLFTAPWTAIKTDRERAAVVVRTGLNLAAFYARISAPFIPWASEAITEALGQPWPPTWPSQDIATELDRLTRGAPMRAPEVLFKKIEDEQVAEWTERFGGEPG